MKSSNRANTQRAQKRHIKNKARKARAQEQMQFHYMVALGKAWKEIMDNPKKAGDE